MISHNIQNYFHFSFVLWIVLVYFFSSIVDDCCRNCDEDEMHTHIYPDGHSWLTTFIVSITQFYVPRSICVRCTSPTCWLVAQRQLHFCHEWTGKWSFCFCLRMLRACVLGEFAYSYLSLSPVCDLRPSKWNMVSTHQCLHFEHFTLRHTPSAVQCSAVAWRGMQPKSPESQWFGISFVAHSVFAAKQNRSSVHYTEVVIKQIEWISEKPKTTSAK